MVTGRGFMYTIPSDCSRHCLSNVGGVFTLKAHLLFLFVNRHSTLASPKFWGECTMDSGKMKYVLWRHKT